jgi:hypothetical protein
MYSVFLPVYGRILHILREKPGLICVISSSYVLISLTRVYFDVFLSIIILSLKFGLLCYVISKAAKFRKKALTSVWNLY